MKYPSRFPKSVPKRARDGTPKEGDCPTHRKWIRQQPCVIGGYSPAECRGRVQCCHVRNGTELAGMGRKPHDRWTVPMCAMHHRIQSDMGEARFSEQYEVNLWAIAQLLAARSPDPKVKT